MPIVDVTCAPSVDDDDRRLLAAALPHAVSVAVACTAEPYDGDLRPGDVIVRFHDTSPHDSLGLDVVVEVHSRWDADRVADRDRRCATLLQDLRSVLPGTAMGVFLRLPVAAWSQRP